MADSEAKVFFKDGIDRQAVCRLAAGLSSGWDGFPEEQFITAGCRGLKKLELKDRVRQLMRTMTRYLPDDYPAALEIVQNAGSNWPEGNPDNPFNGFAAWPLIDWVGAEGLNHPDISLAALRQLTSLFSAEFAIRPFLLQHTESTLKELQTWVHDDDHHVRRLISEGTRPRLPWGQQLPMFMADPAPVLELLQQLKDDESQYVRRSVANNLNDIVKDHPELAAQTGVDWMVDASIERQRLVKHGLRTLIKQGHPGALTALGFEVDPKVDVSFSINTNRLIMGEYLVLESNITSTGKGTQKLVVDYALHFMKANGSLSPKVFKWKVLDLEPGQNVKLKKKMKIMNRSVRKLYAGNHEVEMLIAGKGYGKESFLLKNEKPSG